MLKSYYIALNRKENFTMPIPDNLVPINNPLENIDIKTFKQNMPMPQLNYIQPKISEPLVRPNPIHETNRILREQNEKIDELSFELEKANLEIANQTVELHSIHYENMKLNAQIEVLNKTLDSQRDELERLRGINAELKTTNQTIEDNNKHSTRKAILLAIGTGVVLITIEHWHDIYIFILHLIK